MNPCQAYKRKLLCVIEHFAHSVASAFVTQLKNSFDASFSSKKSFSNSDKLIALPNTVVVNVNQPFHFLSF